MDGPSKPALGGPLIINTIPSSPPPPPPPLPPPHGNNHISPPHNQAPYHKKGHKAVLVFTVNKLICCPTGGGGGGCPSCGHTGPIPVLHGGPAPPPPLYFFFPRSLTLSLCPSRCYLQRSRVSVSSAVGFHRQRLRS